jgi:hypothetical protein
MLDWGHMETAVRERFERIEAILDGVAKKQAAAAARVDKADARMDRSDARFEKRMRGFENLVRIGMKKLAEQRRLTADLRRSQQRTEASLRAFLDSMRKGGNGHSRGH